MSESMILTNGYLKETMPDAMVYRGVCLNLDTAILQGIYMTTVETECQSPPGGNNLWQYAILEVLKRSNVIFQRLTTQEGVFFRVGKSIDTLLWGNWKAMTM